MVEIVIIVVVLVLCFVPAGITVAKGHVALFVAGFFVTLVCLIAPFRLAKPNSPWAHRFYGPEKLERSRRRYPDLSPSAPSRAGLAATLGFGALGAAFVGGVIVGLAS